MRQLAVTTHKNNNNNNKKKKKKKKKKKEKEKKQCIEQVPESTPITSHTIINHSATNACPHPFQSLT